MDLFIRVQGSLNFDTLDAFLADNNNVLNNNCAKYDSIIFDLEKLTFISPVGFCTLACLIKYCQYNKIANKYKLIPSKHVNSYFERMDFYNAFGVDAGISQCRYDCSNRLMELKEIRGQNPNEDSRIAEHFKHIFQSQIKGDSNILEAVSYSIGEIVDNTIRHSLSPINGFICAQTYRNRRKLEICIADCGVGIPQSLRSSNNIELSESDCLVCDYEYILYALRKGISSKYGNGHTGEGLFFTSEFIKENCGRMKIISGNGLYLLNNGNNVLQRNIDCWKGTIVALEFQLDKEVNVKNIFDREFPLDIVGDFDWI